MAKFGGVPERFKAEGLFVHGREKVVAGDYVLALRAVEGSVETLQKDVVYRVAKICVEPNGNDRGFDKRIKLEGCEGDFNPKRFRKVIYQARPRRREFKDDRIDF